MKIFLSHGIKLTIANLLGLVISLMCIAFGLLFFGSILLILLLGNFLFTFIENIIHLFQYMSNHSFFEIVNHLSQENNELTKTFSSFSITDSPLILAVSILLLICYGIYQLTIQSMMIGGLYGSAVNSIYNDKGVFGAYFSYSFRNLGKLLQLQFLLLILSIPFFILLVIFNIGLQTLIESPNIIYFQASFSLIFLLIFLTLFLQSPIIMIKENVGAFKAISLQFQILKQDLYTILFSGALFFASLLLINGIFFLMVAILLQLSGVPILNFSFDQLTIFSYLILGLAFLIWAPIVLPYSLTCSVLILVKQYKQRLHHYVSSSDESSEKTLGHNA